jgi:molybdate transport system substrate-binding protein
MMKRFLKLALVAVVLLAVSSVARAQSEVTLVTIAGIRPPLDQLIPKFEQKTGIKVKLVLSPVAPTRNHVVKGDAFDLAVVLDPDAEVLKSSNIVPGSAVTIASLAVGAAVPQGAPKPDISTPEATKKALLAAKSISYADPAGASAAGTSFSDTLKRLGVTDQVQSKVKLGKGGGEAMATVVKRDADIGFVFYNEMNEKGIDLVGPLPVQVSPRLPLVGLISSHAANAAGAKALLQFLASPEAQSVYKAERMDPAS